MAQSKCPACPGTRFEVKETPPMSGTDWIWGFVQCKQCGAVVGVIDYWPNSQILERLKKIEKRLGLK